MGWGGLQVVDVDGRAGGSRDGGGEQRDGKAGADQLADAAWGGRFQLHAGLEARCGGRGVEDRPQAAVGGKAGERLVSHLGERYPGVAGEPVSGWGDEDELLVDERLSDVLRGQVGVDGSEDEVDVAGVECGEQLSDEAGAQRERDAWVAGGEAGEGGGQVERAEDRRGAEGDSAAQGRGELGEVGAGAVEFAEHPPGPGQEQLAGLGERDPPCGAGEQGDAELALEVPDLRGDRRLRDAQPLGGAGEAAAARDRVEVPQLPQLHLLIVQRDECQHKPVLDLSVPTIDADVMQQRRLGPDRLVTSALGLGCMGLSQAYGPADDDESLSTVRRALDLGVTLLDTAMSYGAGHNETLVGRSIRGRREQVVLATKVGIVRDDSGVRLDGRPERVHSYCDASLTRLGVETIDLYYLHRVDPQVPVADTVGAMAELVAAGKVRHLGLSEVTAEQLEQAAAVHPITALQLEWSLFWREPEDEIIPAARRLGIGLVPYSPLGRGMLTAVLPAGGFGDRDFRAGDPRFIGAALEQNTALVVAVRQLAAARGVTAGQLALAWLLAQGPDVVPIPGTRRAQRVEENVAAVDVQLTPGDFAELEQTAPRAAWAGDRFSFAAPHTARSLS